MDLRDKVFVNQFLQKDTETGNSAVFHDRDTGEIQHSPMLFTQNAGTVG